MAYPLVILGAGAANDFMKKNIHHPVGFSDTDLDKYQPPLTNELFDTRKAPAEIISTFPEVSSLASEAIYSIKGEVSFEEYLTNVQEKKAPHNPERYKQLIALRFYLSKLFRAITNNYYKSVNNYNALLTKIYDVGGKACFVNFNYDLLLEENIAQIKNCEDINDYMKNSIKVIKLHGACNWFYKITTKIPDKGIPHSYDYFMEFAKKYADYIEDQKDKKIPVIKNSGDLWYFEEDSSSERNYYLPSIAIPITKKGNYVCPQNHIEELEKCLPKIDRVLILGWKANDPYLLDFLIGKLNENLKVNIVSRGSSQEIEKRLLNLGLFKNARTTAHKMGFTEYMESGECDNFLA